jgi:hypothetical protein
MRKFALLLTVAVIGIIFTATAPAAQAQVGVGVEVGPAPVCPYGYYDVAPYNCAPYGYYGPEWFVNGGFIGIGPWFHGPNAFTATLIRISIQIMDTKGRSRNVARQPRDRLTGSKIFMAGRCVTGTVTSANKSA